jgi:hypothetical protein
MSLVVDKTGITFPDATSITSAKVSQLSNDTGFITSSSLPTRVSQLSNDSGFITSASIPTRVSQLSNDTGFITSSSIPTRVSQLSNDTGFITSASTPSYYYNGVGSYTTAVVGAQYSIGGNYGLSGLSGTWTCMGAIATFSGPGTGYSQPTAAYVYLFLRIA